MENVCKHNETYQNVIKKDIQSLEASILLYNWEISKSTELKKRWHVI